MVGEKKLNNVNIYFLRREFSRELFSSNMLQGTLGMKKVDSILLDTEVTLMRLLDIVIPALVRCKSDGVFFGLELDGSSLHIVTRRSPTHHFVFPSVDSRNYIPVDSPWDGLKVTRLSCRLAFLENADDSVSRKVGWSSTYGFEIDSLGFVRVDESVVGRLDIRLFSSFLHHTSQ